MAEAAEDSMACLLCLEECVEPVTLSCEHRFCSRCLREHWAPSNTGHCAKCKRKSSLFLTSECVLEGEDSENQKEGIGLDSEHTSAVSQGGASEREECEKFQSEINRLKEKKERTENIMKQYKFMLQHAEGQKVLCESQIMQQFKWFHQFLVQEEVLCQSALRKEHREKTQIIEEELKKLEVDLVSLSDCICSAEQQLQGQGTQSCSLNKHMERLDEPEPQLRSGLLVGQATILGNLGFRVWKKMETIVKYRNVILDPNTAHKKLRLSEDLAGVQHADTPQYVPLNPERATTSPSVLGSEGFSSGVHQWKVEVGDHPDWSIGVAKESVNRRITQEGAGFWCLTYSNGTYSDPDGNKVKLKKLPQRILVDLHCGKGGISFYNSEDNTLICSHTVTFTEKVYPFISVGKADGGNVTKDIKIHPFGIVVSKGIFFV